MALQKNKKKSFPRRLAAHLDDHVRLGATERSPRELHHLPGHLDADLRAVRLPGAGRVHAGAAPHPLQEGEERAVHRGRHQAPPPGPLRPLQRRLLAAGAIGEAGAAPLLDRMQRLRTDKFVLGINCTLKYKILMQLDHLCVDSLSQTYTGIDVHYVQLLIIIAGWCTFI